MIRDFLSRYPSTQSLARVREYFDPALHIRKDISYWNKSTLGSSREIATTVSANTKLPVLTKAMS